MLKLKELIFFDFYSLYYYFLLYFFIKKIKLKYKNDQQIYDFFFYFINLIK